MTDGGKIVEEKTVDENVMVDDKLQASYILSMDIGTRSIIGMVGCVEEGKLCVLAIEKEEHHVRAMVDGQIEDIQQVAKVAASVKEKLERKTGIGLDKAYVAAAGRALRTQKVTYELELENTTQVTEDFIRNLETGALMKAEEAFGPEQEDTLARQFYLVGYTVSQYYLDGYPISSLLDHKGKVLKADVIATFLPSGVVESLTSSMQKAGIEVAGMTLEPIASMNASIPKELRLLNLVLVDIGAGTSDIAVARDGSICGYTMATIAGDEITECLMKEYLIDFQMAESLKMQLGTDTSIKYIDVLGMEHEIDTKELREKIKPFAEDLGLQIAERILEVNGGPPSAVFLAGGGSKLDGIREMIAKSLEMDLSRVALGGNNFYRYAVSKEYDLNDPEYSTPLGIGISAGLNLINDNFYVKLNGQRAKLFRSGRLTVRDVLMMNGYGYKHMISRSGQSLKIEIDDKKRVVRGEFASPAQIQLNGRQASAGDIVNAGDEIVFIPAINGKDPELRLRELTEFRDNGTILFDGKEFPIGILAKVGDEFISPDTVLRQGDKFCTVHMLTLGDLAAYWGTTSPLVVNGQPAHPGQALRPSDVVETAGPGKEIFLGEITVQLNGRQVTLPLKNDLQPCYLMDLLDMTGMDFTVPKGIVVLKANGREAAFQTEVKTGDIIEIYWSEDQH